MKLSYFHKSGQPKNTLQEEKFKDEINIKNMLNCLFSTKTFLSDGIDHLYALVL